MKVLGFVVKMTLTSTKSRSSRNDTHQFTFPNAGVTFQWSEMMTFSQYYSTGGGSSALDVFHSNYTDLRIAAFCSWIVCDFFFSSSLCFIWGRIVELFSPGPISPHWGVLSKCLAYSKAASDPFVYSLLRHQYRKTCSLLANKVLKRSPLNSSSVRTENNAGRNNSNTTNNIQPPNNKPLGQWRSWLSETIRVLYRPKGVLNLTSYFKVGTHENIWQ